ncbi:MAG: DUF3662 and FHA domain-containing protein [Corynebacterium sp.]|nr:DUF3662 and FHA domain-containing protein [Corynebacterium sp.]
MAFLDRLAKLDSSMQRGLDNSMAFVFGGKVVPAEIEELLKQEATDKLVRGENGVLYCPNVMSVGVSSKDLENLSQSRGLPDDLADQFARYARNAGWQIPGPVVVRIGEESALRTGQLRVSSFIDGEPEEVTGFDAIFHDGMPAPQFTSKENSMHEPIADDAATEMFSQPEQHAPEGIVVNLLVQDGSSRTYLVHEGSNIIGRSNDSHLRLPDTGVSRQHAEITFNGVDALLVDLQSTNGTKVNDIPIENWLLADGDVITLGHSHIEVRITNASS